jgi:hypothetical protein
MITLSLHTLRFVGPDHKLIIMVGLTHVAISGCLFHSLPLIESLPIGSDFLSFKTEYIISYTSEGHSEFKVTMGAESNFDDIDSQDNQF